MEHAYTIVVKTGFKVGGWTKDDVFITINGQNEQAIEHNFRDFDNNAFTVGALHRFEFENAQDLGPNPTIKLRRTGGFFSVWYIDWIEIVQDGNIQSVFPVQKWIKKDRLYIVNHIDTCLPQNALRGDMRALELESIQKEYQLEVKEPGLPPQVGFMHLCFFYNVPVNIVINILICLIQQAYILIACYISSYHFLYTNNIV